LKLSPKKEKTTTTTTTSTITFAKKIDIVFLSPPPFVAVKPPSEN
jgi:hypothetical protein